MRPVEAAHGQPDAPAAPEQNDDPSLLDLALAGDRAAFTEVADRHRARARAFAARLLRDGDPDKAVSHGIDTLERDLLDHGTLPLPFRPRLLAELRRGQQGLGSRGAHEALVSSQWAAAQDVYAELSERSQALLWHGVVERDSPDDVGRAAGLAPAAVPDAVAVGRTRFRDRYVQDHLSRVGKPECRRAMVGPAGDGGTPSEEHRARCTDCRRLTRDLMMIEKQLDWVIATVALGAHALIYLALRRVSVAPAADGASLEAAVDAPESAVVETEAAEAEAAEAEAVAVAAPGFAAVDAAEPVAPKTAATQEPETTPRRAAALTLLPGLAADAVTPARSAATSAGPVVVPSVAGLATMGGAPTPRRRGLIVAAAAALIVGAAGAVAWWPGEPSGPGEVLAVPAGETQFLDGQLLVPLKPAAPAGPKAVRGSGQAVGHRMFQPSSASAPADGAAASAARGRTTPSSATGRAGTAEPGPAAAAVRGNRPAHAGQQGPPPHAKAGGNGKGKAKGHAKAGKGKAARR